MPNRTITRSTVNKDQYAAQEFPKSGFAPSYSRHTSAIIGRLHASGYQYVMPGDKIYGRNSGNFTFNHIVTPMLTPLDCGQYTFYLPFRAVDTTFEDGLTPTELNSMSANWHTPKCNTASIFVQLCTALYGDDLFEDGSNLSLPAFFVFLHNYLVDNPDAYLGDFVDSDSFPIENLTVLGMLYGNNDNSGLIRKAIYNLSENENSSIQQQAKAMYIDDALLDIADNIRVKCGDFDNMIFNSDTKISDFVEIFLDALLTPWIGRYSYYGEFRFDYLRPKDYHMLAHPAMYNLGKISVNPQRPITYAVLFSNTPQCEYALRIMYVIWYERFRDIHLEPVNATLPYWRRFGSTSILDTNNGGNLCYLLLRIRSWYDDPYTSAQVDDISRHVYAPVFNSVTGRVGSSVGQANRLDTQTAESPYNVRSGGLVKPAVYTLGYIDQMSGDTKRIDCPVPANVNDVLESVDRDFYSVYGLDLNTLRQSQMLERYLKRNYLFGDEYQDRMLAHYGSRVSDMRINRPELLGQSLNQSDMQQEISNVSTDAMSAGERTATATVQFGGDDYGTYCEEFGMVINILSFMPRAIYDGIDAHLLLDKQTDFPLPEFATNNEEFGRKMEIASSGVRPFREEPENDKTYMFGRYPAYHIWRGRTDEVGGMFLNELQDCTFRRFWGVYSLETTPKLNYWFLHCRPNLGMFTNTNRYDSQLYGNINHEFYVERVLPTPVENI